MSNWIFYPLFVSLYVLNYFVGGNVGTSLLLTAMFILVMTDTTLLLRPIQKAIDDLDAMFKK